MIRPGPLPRRSCPEDHRGPLGTSLPSLSSCSPGSLSDPRAVVPGRGQRRAPASPSLGASGGPPFLQLLPGQGSPQGFLSPHTEPLSCSGTSSLQPVCPVRPQVQSAWEARPFVPTLTPTHTRLRAAGRRVVTKAGSHGIRKVWKPLSFLHPLPPVTWLGAGAGRPQGGPGLGLWVCFDWSVICCPLG